MAIRRTGWRALARAVECLAIAALVASPPARAQEVEQVWQVNIHGTWMSCVSFDRRRVLIELDYGSEDVGYATRLSDGTPLIVLNPDVVESFSPAVAQFWFVHECGHHILAPELNSETAADCFAIQDMVRNGVARREDLYAFREEMAWLSGSPEGHLPGPQRASHIIECGNDAMPKTRIARLDGRQR